jgi:RHS repeat-associated protein
MPNLAFSRVQAPAISSPKGGGAVRGIGDKFAANPATGTGSLNVPIVTSEGRSGFHPQLSLSYDSSNGNGPFGLGWALATPSITRKTDKGLPQYRDGEESDVYVLSGAEDLVPMLREDLTRFVDDTTAEGYVIHRYRPRTEGVFARIERWTQTATGDVHWRSITPDNVTTRYGKDSNSRITDGARVFSWLVCESYDDKGNAVVYEYIKDNEDNVDLTQSGEQHRSRGANRYVKRIRYGNRVSRLVQPDLEQASWLFEVVFDYDEGHVEPVTGESRFVRAAAAPARPWSARPDPFSVYRMGFEVRSHRRCHRVLMFHHFPGEPGYDGLVASTEFDYADITAQASVDEELAHQGSTRFGSFLRKVTHAGFAHDDTKPVVVHGDVEFATYLREPLPPVEFEYSRPVIQDTVHEIDPTTLPYGLNGPGYQWVDLHGEGISGVLTEQDGTWYYHRNTSPLTGRARFSPAEPVALTPSMPASDGARLMDLAGDGRPDLVSLDGPLAGFQEHDDGEGWLDFRPFTSRLNRDSTDANTRLVDLTGDGHADVLITQDDALVWHQSLAEEGFRPAVPVAQPYDENAGPHVVFADADKSVYLADMSGDGLTDLVRIRNGEVCYWPNLGYGRFGAKITMAGSPWFDAPDQFDERRILLADIDGSGTTDIIYLHGAGVRLYFNRSGNGFSAARRLDVFPPVHDLATITPVDLLGTGTACLVWFSPLASDANRPVRYVDLMAGGKPHLLTKSVNNLGAETVVQYAPSTKFYVADREAGRPWISRLPFPVYVVERVETIDRISGNRFVTRYGYHHGDYDGTEREFRGFGMVEQWDTEHTTAAVGSNEDATSHVPPVLTRSWLHTGVHIGREHVSDFFASREYYREPGLTGAQARALLLADTVLPDGLTVDEEREACRVLRGSVLRKEVYALDGSGTEAYPYGHPYTVIEQNYNIRMLQPKAGKQSAVFLAHAREALTYQYERNPADPRIGHAVTLAADDYGNELQSATIGYPRRTADPLLSPEIQDMQADLLITCAEHGFTKPIDTTDAYRTPLPCETRTYELTGATPAAARFTFDEVLAAVSAATPLSYEQPPTPGKREKRLLDHVRAYFRSNDLASRLPLGITESLALAYESYQLTLTPGLVAAVYGTRVTDAMLAEESRYAHLDGDANWWSPSGRSFLSPNSADSPAAERDHARAHFFMPCRYRDPFHTNAVSTEQFVRYDTHDLLVLETLDAHGNRVTAGVRDVDPAQPLVSVSNDYRVLQPTVIMDPNRNRTAIAFDALGAVAATAVMGKPEDTPAQGDQLTGVQADLTPAQIEAALGDPLGATALLGGATSRVVRDLHAYTRSATPAATVVFAREQHTATTPVHIELSYSDGLGREIQRKVPAEPAPDDAAPRWVGTGWKVFDNKGMPVREYEPFFTGTHRFESTVLAGVSILRCYDPLGRVAATLHPDHTWEKVAFGPWRQETWDVNDTLLVADPSTDPTAGPHFARIAPTEYLPTWFALRTDPAHAAAFAARYPDLADRAHQTQAAVQTKVHAATPGVIHADTLGRAIGTVAHNRAAYSDNPVPVEEFHRTRIVLDIESQQREVVDAKDRVVMRYEYDLLGRRIRQSGMESGEVRTLHDTAGRPCFVWDAADRRFRTTYDALRRPTGTYLGDVVIQRTVYGESRPAPESANLRGRAVEAHDQAGAVVTDDFDFKGNALSERRRLAQNYATTIDVSAAVPLEAETFTGRTRFDALNRPVQVIAPHSDRPGTVVNVIQPVHNLAGLLDQVHVWLDLATEPTDLLDPATATLHAVTDIDYDAKGQRTLVVHGNAVRTSYSYDPLTYQITRLLTQRDATAFPQDCPDPAPTGWPGCQVQNLHYTSDPAGHTTHVRDAAQQTVFFRNRRVEPSADFTYDATYRLIEATGREHLGQTGGSPNAPTPHSYNDFSRLRRQHPEDGAAMGSYLERYIYDAVGNIQVMRHRGSDPAHSGWTRTYSYLEASQLDPAVHANRLSSTTIGGTTEAYTYDTAGNMLQMSHLQALQWDLHDQLRMTRRQAVNADDVDGQLYQGERTFYVYDALGERIRKVTESPTGQVKEERIYLGGFEIYRRAGASPLQRETLHVMDDERLVALVETRVVGTEPGVPRQRVRYQFGNHVGAGNLELDSTAQVISYEETTPYGSTSYQAVSAQTVTPNRYRFTGKERDEESGFFYHGARYYAPWLARWTSCDPGGLKDGPCLYGYCRGNPIMLQDADGAEGKPRLPGLIGNDPKVGKLWEQAVVEELGGRFGTTGYKDTVASYQKELAKKVAENGLGSNRAKGTGINYARRTYGAVRTRFGKLAKAAGISLDGVQVHHTFDELAKLPEHALETTNLSFQKGNAGTKGSGHYFAHEVKKAADAGVKEPARQVVEKLHAEGIHPDVPELSPTLHGPHTPPGVHSPKGAHVPKGPKGPKGKPGGIIGKVIAVGIAGYVLLDTGDAYAAVQTLNPLANVTDTLVEGDITVGNVVWSIGKDVYGLTPLATAQWVLFDLMGPQGDNIYDPKLTARALQEGRNPFCAQCHGPGGALDPNNEWNRKHQFPQIDLQPNAIDRKALIDWVSAQQH